MKKSISYAAFAVLSAAVSVSCDERVYRPIDFELKLNEGNTYLAGDPVRFDFVGNANFLVLYTGTKGHEYRFHDRTRVDIEDMEYCTLEVMANRRAGTAGSVQFWVTNQFGGILGGTDADLSNLAADKAAINAMVDSGMETWERVPMTGEGGTGTNFTFTYDITHLADNFCLGLRWYPIYNPPSSVQGGYLINPVIRVKFKDYEEQEMQFRSLNVKVIAMPEQRAADAYTIPPGTDPAPGYVTVTPATAVNQVVMTSVWSATPDLGYRIDTWLFSTPQTLNAIAPDQGENIKGYSTDLSSYEVTYDEPGTYTATFVATNGNYDGQSRVVREVTFTIVEPIE